MFFVDKHTPKTIDEAIFHKPQLELLKRMSKDKSITHIIFSGVEGVGKQTLIKLFLELLYDSDVNKLNDSIYKVVGSGNTPTEVTIKQSNYHIIIEPNNNNFDRYLIQDVVKDYAKKIPLNVFTTKKPFKTVLINNIDNMSYYAQTSLRRTMEKYSGTCRFIMWCKSLSRVIDPIRSRCYCFRIPSPTDDEMVPYLAEISYREKIVLDLCDYAQIISLANGNIKKALWLLQLKQIGESYTTSYEETIDKIIQLMMTGDIKVVLEIRILLYSITITNILGSQIIKDIVQKLFAQESINEKCIFDIVELAAMFEHRLIKGRRDIIHFDPFIIGVIYVLHYGKKNEK